MRPLLATWLGRDVAYAPAFALQQRLAERRRADDIPDTLLLLEHAPVYTLGRRATDAEVLVDDATLAERGIAVERSDRGGRVTYHGPGQLVGYPIVDLGATSDLVGYVRSLERALIATLAGYGIESEAVEGLTGVWAGTEKVAAIGIHVSRGITTHGFALNVEPDLGAFNGIVPCGIVDRGVASIASLTGRSPGVRAAADSTAHSLAATLGRSLARVEPAALGIDTASLVAEGTHA